MTIPSQHALKKLLIMLFKCLRLHVVKIFAPKWRSFDELVVLLPLICELIPIYFILIINIIIYSGK